MKPTSGEIHLFGERIVYENPRIRSNIGYLPSEIHLYEDMTGKQLLDFTARAYGLELQNTKTKQYAEMLHFDPNRKIKSYSLGNRKKLGILLSLLPTPRLLILDEPTSGLDPLMQHSFFDLLKSLNEQGMTIFFSTHVLSEVGKICHRVAIIRDGELIQTSRMEEIVERSMPIITVQYEEEGDLIAKYDLSRIDVNATYNSESGQHIFHTRGSIPMNEVLRLISQYPIRDIQIQKPTLEELFMTFYKDEVAVK